MEWYNPQNIREIITTLGFKITAADKQEDLMFKPLSELTFLKRNFSNLQIKIRGVERTYMVGALQDEVFFKMLNWCKATRRRFFRRNTPVHFDRQTIGDTALACLFEACLKGEEYFNDIKNHLISCATEFQIKLPPLPHFRQAFFQTYFKETIPRDVNEIELSSDHPYSPLFVKPFMYGKNEFKTIYQCFEYNKILLHSTKDNNLSETAEKILKDHQLASKLGNSITVNEKFNVRRLLTSIIKARFSTEVFKINEIDLFKNLQHHQILGGANNEYGKLLTEFAKSHRMAPESKKINKIKKLTTFEKRINRYKLNLINKEGVIDESKLLNFSNKISKNFKNE
nr:non-structural polyprotein [Bat calicivirus]